jgi:hypothetical protein
VSVVLEAWADIMVHQKGWIVLGVLTAIGTDAMLCGRAGGVITGQEGVMNERVQEFETPAACDQRGCVWRAEEGECHYHASMQAVNITTVHMIQSNHLDVGYTDTAVNVINQYFDVFFPRAVKIGKELRESGGPERMKWMTQTYVVRNAAVVTTPPEPNPE